MPSAVSHSGLGSAPGAVASVSARHGVGTVATPVETALNGSLGWGSMGGFGQGVPGGASPIFDSVGTGGFGGSGAGIGALPSPAFVRPRAGGDWAFESRVDWDAGTQGAYSLSVAFNQGRWIAEVGSDLYWVYATGAPSDTDLYGRVVLEAVDEGVLSRSSPPHYSAMVTRVEFDEHGYQPTLVVPPPGTDGAYMVVFVGEAIGDSIPLRYAWRPSDAGFATDYHAPSAETETVGGGTVTTERCGYPSGVVTEDGDYAFVTYTLSNEGSDDDPSRRVRLLQYSNSAGTIVDDFEVDVDTLDAGYTHSHFPSVAVSAVSPAGPTHVVMVVWRSYLPDPDPTDREDPPGAIRGRYFLHFQGRKVYESDPFDVASPTEGGFYGSDPSVIGLNEGQFVIAFQAQPADLSARGAVHTRSCSVSFSGVTLGDFARVEASTVTAPHKFPSLATNEARDRVLMAYEVGKSGQTNAHGTRMAVMDLADPTVWTTMGWVDVDGNGVCDPTDDGQATSTAPSTDTVELVGDLGAYLQQSRTAASPEQTINPCAVLRSGGRTGYVGMAFNADLGGTDAMSLRLFAVTVPS